MAEQITVNKDRLREFLMALAEDLYQALDQGSELVGEDLEALTAAVENTIVELEWKDEDWTS